MHPPEIRKQAMALVADGLNDCEVSRRLAIPRSTVRDWRRPTYQPSVSASTVCPRCWRRIKGRIEFSDDDYAELLGLYLGDGCISTVGRVFSLRLSLDLAYPGIIADAKALLARSFPDARIGVVKPARGAYVVLSMHSLHLPCLFPQHGSGKKHERAIVLEPWQSRIVATAPWAFLRGCIRSDGCAYVNRTGRYEYLSYVFKNVSREIVDLFTAACDAVGVSYRLNIQRVRRSEHRWGSRDVWSVRIYQRPSVALMLQHVGRKT